MLLPTDTSRVIVARIEDMKERMLWTAHTVLRSLWTPMNLKTAAMIRATGEDCTATTSLTRELVVEMVEDGGIEAEVVTAEATEDVDTDEIFRCLKPIFLIIPATGTFNS
jgi:hypothetical protein